MRRETPCVNPNVQALRRRLHPHSAGRLPSHLLPGSAAPPAAIFVNVPPPAADHYPMKRWMRPALHWLYYVALAFKSADAALETAGAVLFFVHSAAGLRRLANRLTGSILGSDPDNAIALAVRHSFSHLSPRQRVFGALFLLGHGIIKTTVVVGLWMRWRWAARLAIVALAGFAAYEGWRGIHTRSVAYGAVAAIDIAAAGLVWNEFRRAGRKGAHAGQ